MQIDLKIRGFSRTKKEFFDRYLLLDTGTLDPVMRSRVELLMEQRYSSDSPLVPTLVPTLGKTSTLQSILDKIASAASKLRMADAVAVRACPGKQNRPLTSTVNGRLHERETGIEPATTSLGS
jgi:hypothetical protein